MPNRDDDWGPGHGPRRGRRTQKRTPEVEKEQQAETPPAPAAPASSAPSEDRPPRAMNYAELQAGKKRIAAQKAKGGEEEGFLDTIKSAGSGILSDVKEAASGLADWFGFGNDKKSPKDVPVREAVSTEERDRPKYRTATHKYTPPSPDLNKPTPKPKAGVLSAEAKKAYAAEDKYLQDYEDTWQRALDKREQWTKELNERYKKGEISIDEWRKELKELDISKKEVADKLKAFKGKRTGISKQRTEGAPPKAPGTAQTFGVGKETPVKSKNLPPTEEKPGVLSEGDEKFYAREAARRMETTNMWKEARDNPRNLRSRLLNDEIYKEGLRTKEDWEKEKKRIRETQEFYAEQGRIRAADEKEWAEETADARRSAARHAKVYGKKTPPKKSQSNTSGHAGDPPRTPRKTSKGALEAEKLNKYLQENIF